MNPSEQEIERMLRSAPKPPTPPDLKPRLTAQVRLSASEPPRQTVANLPMSTSRLRRWWPALAPAAISLACVVVLAVQQIQIQKLRETLRASSHVMTTEATPAVAAPQIENPATDPADFAATEQAEIARLKERARQLTAEIAQLEQTQKENEALRTQLAAPPTLTSEEMDALAKAKEKALSIACVNNLKQLGLAARQWAIDNNDVFPPAILSMSNELNTPKILVCPADTNRLIATNWTTFTSANCSYQYLSPSTSSDHPEPYQVLSRCPIHGHIGMCDGSVQGMRHPEWLVERDGKLFYQDPRVTPTPDR